MLLKRLRQAREFRRRGSILVKGTNMNRITLLNQETIDKIAAGEVVERPSSVVKELTENAIDAGATAITVEIKEGGISFIRITDNGCGIASEEIPVAFLRHSTSKIRSVEDLLSVSSLGFRGEALSSIAAVSRVEMITKTGDALMGSRYVIEGSKELVQEEVGAPDGTTFLVKDLFYNTPARRKFLKSAQTEGTYVADLVERLALSHPNISFKFINNNQTKLHTSGNGNTKDLIYHIYGREIAASLIEVKSECELFSVSGYIGKPVVTRGNRNYENYFINERYVKSRLIAKAIEEAYQKFIMHGQYPFTVLYFQIDSSLLDVNVHPSKMELRFERQQEIYSEIVRVLDDLLSGRDLIPRVPVTNEKPEPPMRKYTEPIPEPFEKRRLNDIHAAHTFDTEEHRQPTGQGAYAAAQGHIRPGSRVAEDTRVYRSSGQTKASEPHPPADTGARQTEGIRQEPPAENKYPKGVSFEEQTLSSISPDFMTQEARKSHRIIGQLFDTYWLIEYQDQLYIIDQHAAHEKVLYERMMAQLSEKEFTSQMISPPIILSLDNREVEMLNQNLEQIERFGYSIEPFGGREYMITAVPDNLYHIDMKELFIEMLDDFSNLSGRETPQLILEKIASMSCKAAVKGNNRLSLQEADALIEELLTLENPYNCPHGRPVIIAMTKYEIEKKFKRIV